jgi:hypothetical protein
MIRAEELLASTGDPRAWPLALGLRAGVAVAI